MSSPTAGALRFTRAAAFGTVAFALALLAHTVSGGPTPRPVVLTLLAVGVAAGSVLLTGRKLGAAGLMLALGGVQAGLHVAFMALAPVAGCSTMSMPMSHHGATSMTLCSAGADASASMAPVSTPLVMVLAHAAATLALAVLLARGERALWLLFTLLLPALCLRVAPLLRPRPRPVRRVLAPCAGRRANDLRRGRATRATAAPRPLRLTRQRTPEPLRSFCGPRPGAARPGASPHRRPQPPASSPLVRLSALRRPPRRPPLEGNPIPVCTTILTTTPRSTGLGRRATRVAAVATAAAVATLATAGAAAAHVHVHPDSTASGSYAQLTFRVPNESPTASTTKIVVTLPQDTPLSSVSTRPVPGWRAVVTDATLPKPVDVSGTTLTTAPHVVTWTASPGSAIAPKQYQEFAISAGPLPAPGELTLPVAQTYSDGKVVSWSQPAKAGEPEPEHPAPAFEVTAATGSDDDAMAAPAGDAAAGAEAQPASHATAEQSDPAARWLGAAALVIALLAAAGVVVTRRRPGTGNG